MARPALPLLALAAVVVLAGCLGGFTAGTETSTTTTEPPTTDPTDTRTDTTTDPATPTTTGTPTYRTADCPYILSVEPATVDQREEADTIRQFENRTEREQELFAQALENGSVESDTLPDLWSSPGVVEYQNETYYVVAAVC
ncbi:hypothetical protein [Haloarchaeobius amylolyticus]|uniref:hypothetical protein n=1 Tax=Haloarchaeobius amylolyticus TaxID=1198296 RepID=UPI00226F5A7E|nr:hypothetical protein [Haloarchaeobius amylolyticus]